MNWPVIEKEIQLRTARSGGAGGQHVNKVESKVELVWLPRETAGLSSVELERLLHHLKHRIDKKGQLTVVSQSDRSQHRNRSRALAELRQLIAESLRPIPRKRKAGAFKASRKKRREMKKRQSEKKQGRRKFYG